jgi:hypothetical protein
MASSDDDALLASAIRKMLRWAGWFANDYSSIDITDMGAGSEDLLVENEIDALRRASSRGSMNQQEEA